MFLFAILSSKQLEHFFQNFCLDVVISDGSGPKLGPVMEPGFFLGLRTNFWVWAQARAGGFEGL